MPGPLMPAHRAERPLAPIGPEFVLPIADYSLPAAGAYPVVGARRLSIRRRAGFGRRGTPVRSARIMCCLRVMNTTAQVCGVARSLSLLRWPGQVSGPESWPALGVLAVAPCLAVSRLRIR